MQISFNEFQSWLKQFYQLLKQYEKTINQQKHHSYIATQFIQVMNQYFEEQEHCNEDKDIHHALIKLSQLFHDAYKTQDDVILYQFATIFESMAKESRTVSFLELLERGLNSVEHQSNDYLGDKTMLDVWLPAVALYQKHCLTALVLKHLVNQTQHINHHGLSYDQGAMISALLFYPLL